MRYFRIFFFISIIGILNANVLAHPWKPSHYIIIDTDGGLDDMRAISLMMASPDIRILAITASSGVLDAQKTYYKINGLLNEFHHEGIRTGIQYSTNKSKNCQTALNYKWGKDTTSVYKAEDATAMLNELLKQSHENIAMVCLGSLNTAVAFYKECPDFSKQIKKIIWSAESENLKNSFNYCLDKKSYAYLTQQKINIDLVNGKTSLQYDREFKESLKNIANPYSIKIQESINNTNPVLFDEMTALYIQYSVIFTNDTIGKIIVHQIKPNIAKQDIISNYKNILTGQTINQNQVLRQFPTEPEKYFPDVQPIMQATILRYGQDEWTAQIIANELHRHLGVYAVIGVKMGTRARDFFGAGIDEIRVLSYAGLIPPYSCMNDGLQVSTGATLGHGLISVSKDSIVLPTAEFIYLGRKIRISLRDEYRTKIEKEIKEIAFIYGLDSNIYWELVRKSAIKYWSSWDRNEIFNITIQQQ
jgi:inosine-uridine nucleoside N-ribohydrolase/formylmethanofuran dehydrogenase subunit E